MSIVIETHLQCDRCGETFGVDDRWRTGTKQREQAKLNGWSCSGGVDLCETCRRRKNPKPKQP